jgi:hypothetical protein
MNKLSKMMKIGIAVIFRTPLPKGLGVPDSKPPRFACGGLVEGRGNSKSPVSSFGRLENGLPVRSSRMMSLDHLIFLYFLSFMNFIND